MDALGYMKNTNEVMGNANQNLKGQTGKLKTANKHVKDRKLRISNMRLAK